MPDHTLDYQRQPPPASPPSRVWTVIKPAVLGLPVIVLMSVGVGMLVYALNKPRWSGFSATNQLWWEMRGLEERAELLGIASGLIIAGALTAVLYLVGFLLRLTRRPLTAGNLPRVVPPAVPAAPPARPMPATPEPPPGMGGVCR